MIYITYIMFYNIWYMWYTYHIYIYISLFQNFSLSLFFSKVGTMPRVEPPAWGSNSWPWDQDPSQNQVSDAQPTEPFRCPVNFSSLNLSLMTVSSALSYPLTSFLITNNHTPSKIMISFVPLSYHHLPSCKHVPPSNIPNSSLTSLGIPAH